MSPIPRRPLAGLALLVLVGGCGLYIRDDEHLDRVDRDLDGAPISVDCDDDDPEVQVVATWYLDGDRDGIGGDETVESCNQPAGHVLVGGDCDDADPDYAEPAQWYPDGDGDGWGAGAPVEDCGPPPDHVAVGGDCDDLDPAVHPEAAEICNLLDDDCDEEIDEDAAPTTWWTDGDGDGFGDDATEVVTCDPPENGVLVGGDCDDAAHNVNPDAIEECNGYDDDCDDLVDDADPSMAGLGAWYLDADGDGWGDGEAELSCEPIAGRVTQYGDCDDGQAANFPYNDEVCDGIDNDCDGLADDDDTVVLGDTFYDDADGDGHGDPASPIVACDLPPGASVDADDCDDTDPDISPDRGSEVLIDTPSACSNGRDDDCDTLVDGADDDCGDVDNDGIENGIDALYAVDCNGTGKRECLCARADLLLPPDWADDDAIRVFRGESCLVGCVPAAVSELDPGDRDVLGAIDPGAWCWDLRGVPAETFVMRWVSQRSASDPTLAVDPGDCGDWKKIDLSDTCGVLADPWCTTTSGVPGVDPHVDTCDSGGSVHALRVDWNGSSL